MAMARLMPEVLRALSEATGGAFDLVGLENNLFGPSVTSAGLLPGRAVQGALQHDTEHDVALIPAEAINDDGVFIDDLRFVDLEAQASIEVRPSYDFADALSMEGRS
jgi:NifB/MoaA-like Fe-S oxidoreductase